jgi:hypothetical protein
MVNIFLKEYFFTQNLPHHSALSPWWCLSVKFMNFRDFIDDAKIYVIYVQRGYSSFKNGTIYRLGYKSY